MRIQHLLNYVAGPTSNPIARIDGVALSLMVLTLAEWPS